MALAPIKIKKNVQPEEVDALLQQPNLRHRFTCDIVSYEQSEPRLLIIVDDVALDMSVKQLKQIIQRIE